MGRVRRLGRKAAAHGVDAIGRRVLRRHEHWAAPSLWDLAVNELGHLSVRGNDLVEIAETFGTPLHVVHEARLEANFRGFIEAFRRHYPRVEVAYSYKTNPLPRVLHRLHSWGAWAEVISHFELWLALRLGVPADRIIYNGPGKSRDSLALAVERKVALINIDSLPEIDVIERTAEKHEVVQPVGLRVVTSVGWAEQFGLPIANQAAYEAVRLVADCPHLTLAGLHLHLGTGISAVETYLTAIRELAQFAADVRKRHGIRFRYFDLGGGFAAPTVRRFSPLDEVLLQHGLPAWPPALGGPSIAERHAADILTALGSEIDGDRDSPVIIFEPGRAITGSAQFLLLSVLQRKDFGRTTPAIILDGGRNLVMPPSWEYHAVLPVTRAAQSGDRYYDIYGPLCHPGDLLFRGRWLPSPQAGDIFAVMDSGAYFIPNQMNFSNPRPAAVMVTEQGLELVRAREGFEDVIRLDRLDSAAARDC